MATKFEVETCGRCGGSGRYSFNLMHGDRCYGCGGSGQRYSKRGFAARAYFFEGFAKPVEEVVVGMYLHTSIGVNDRPKWREIIEVRESATKWGVGNEWKSGIDLVVKGCNCGFPLGSKVTAATKDEITARLAEALAYEATLGKHGKPLRRAA